MTTTEKLLARSIKQAIVVRIVNGARARDNDAFNVLRGHKIGVEEGPRLVSLRGDVSAWHRSGHWFAGIYSTDPADQLSREYVRDLLANPGFVRTLKKIDVDYLTWPTASRKYPFGITLVIRDAFEGPTRDT